MLEKAKPGEEVESSFDVKNWGQGQQVLSKNPPPKWINGTRDKQIGHTILLQDG